jgi:quercetin dioxygenase-like cupin family protein
MYSPAEGREGAEMDPAYRYYADLLIEVEIPEHGIISRTLYQDDSTKVVLFGFDAGQELSEHTASVPAIIHILKGEGSLTLKTDTQPAQPGTWAYMPANLPHSVVARTPLTMLLVMLRSAKEQEN